MLASKYTLGNSAMDPASLEHKQQSSFPFRLRSPARRIFRKIQEYFENLPYRVADLRHTSRTGICVTVREHCEWWLYNDIFVEGEYDEAINMALSATEGQEQFVALDLGANVGFFALRLMDKILGSGRSFRVMVTAVEGSPSVFRELRDRIASQRQFPNINVQVRLGLVGIRSGFSWIGESRMHIVNSITGIRAVRRSLVPFIDMIAAMESVRKIDLLKCDIEGAEELFLESSGELMEKVNIGIFEFHKKLCSAERCMEIISSHGFRIRVVRDMPDYAVAICVRI